MKPQRQLILDHNPAEGRYGDCYRTCIAILLDLDAHEVPHFVEYSILDGKVDQQGGFRENVNYTLDLTREWLLQRGYTMLSIVAPANCDNHIWLDWTSGMPFILTCKSTRFPDAAHAVVAQATKKDGMRVICCPTTGFPVDHVEPWHDGAGGYYYSIELIVKVPENML